jgi:hypothetical protein
MECRRNAYLWSLGHDFVDAQDAGVISVQQGEQIIDILLLHDAERVVESVEFVPRNRPALVGVQFVEDLMTIREYLYKWDLVESWLK